MLHPAINLCFDPRIFNVLGYFLYDLLDKLFPLRLSGIDLIHQIIKHFRLRILQSQVIQLCLDLGNTEPLRNGRIDVHGLPGLFFLLLRAHKLECSHVVEPVCQLDDNDPDILRHGQEHLTQIFRLHLQLIGGVGQLSQLSDAIHEKGHFLAELLPDLLVCHGRILHHIMEHTRHNGLFVHLQICQDNSHPERMYDIGLTGFSALPVMSFFCQRKRLLYHGNICRWMVLSDPGDQHLVQLLRVLVILRRLHCMAIHNLQPQHLIFHNRFGRNTVFTVRFIGHYCHICSLLLFFILCCSVPTCLPPLTFRNK